MLGDDPAAWDAYPSSEPLRLLWTALRAEYLLAVWGAHQSADPAARSPRSVVAAVISAFRQRMQARFDTACLPEAWLASLPPALVTAELRPQGLAAFEMQWAHRAVLCKVERPAQGPVSLALRLSLLGPAAAPAP
jgi:hypothetical protein